MSILPTPDLVVQEGDLLYLMVPNERVDELQAQWSSEQSSGQKGSA